ncbi:hypothetical protein BJ165DRAFT_1494018 [Panaeolus papilionaceus]|nr:hypothetical protein BJ165DRAFT_1494018 [Panaeolus papilionaceus]
MTTFLGQPCGKRSGFHFPVFSYSLVLYRSLMPHRKRLYLYYHCRYFGSAYCYCFSFHCAFPVHVHYHQPPIIN